MRLASATGALTGALLDFSNSDDAPNAGLTAGAPPNAVQGGAIILAAPTDGVDPTANVCNWGPSELVFAYNAGAAVAPGRLVHLDKNFEISDVPNTGATGRPVYVTLTNFSAGSTTRQGGWLLRSGIAPVQYAVAATTGAVYISATAGQATPTNPMGHKQIVNMTCLIAAASTFTRAVTTQNGSRRVAMTRVTGVYIGQAISGTGIPGGATIAGIEPGGQGVTFSAAATATGTVTGTFTNTGFGICHLDRPFVMGAVS